MKTKTFWIALVVFAFAAFMLLINTNSYYADQHKMNAAFLWGGIACAAVAFFCLIRVAKDWGNSNK